MLVFDFLRNLFERNRRGTAPQRDEPAVAPRPTDDPEIQRMLEHIERRALEAIQNERTAEALLTPRERIKKRLNLPRELSADYRADESIPVLHPPRKRDAVPLVVVVNNVGIGISIPRILFDYLYCQRSLTTDDQHVINDALVQRGLDPESL